MQTIKCDILHYKKRKEETNYGKSYNRQGRKDKNDLGKCFETGLAVISAFDDSGCFSCDLQLCIIWRHPYGIPFLTEKWHWAVTYLLIGVWQGMGWGTIIYLAAITGISGELYEAAMIDGANRWQRMWNITLPGIRGTVVTLLIMNLGKVMGSNYERLDQFGNTQVKDFSYQLAIYIYDKGLASAKFSMATAVGIFQSLVGLVLVLLSDRIAKMLGEEGLL